jgi:deoxyribodipyrimidine photo-lyase
MHIFLFHRDLRLNDNTTLINQIKENENVIPIFIFPPEQIDPKKNNYFSNNSVQFMIESLHELSLEIKKNNGKFYFFKGDNLKVLTSINKQIKIESIGFNVDYTPYARKRDDEIKKWCDKNDIKYYMKEDYLLYDILDGQTAKSNGEVYKVFTPFRNYCYNNLVVREVDKFKLFKFTKNKDLTTIKYNINENEIDDFYENNSNINVHGGRNNGLKILSNISKFTDYDKQRDFLTYKTTFLGAHNHFTTVSIREVYHKCADKIGKKCGLINELHWRDFYVNITYFYPQVLHGQTVSSLFKNKSFKEKYDKITWGNNKKWFEAWCNGQTGFPIIDAGMRQLNETGFMHNRLRMVTSSFLIKDLHIDWRWGERYFATKLVDYSAMQNNGGWLWTFGGGVDSQPYFRIFNPWSQIKYDPDYEFIKKLVPEIKDVPNKELNKWYEPKIHEKWLESGIKYFKPIVEHDIERKVTLTAYKNIEI